MFLHLGNDCMVLKDKIIAILSLDSINNSKISYTFYHNQLKSGKVQKIAEKGKEKSFIITTSGMYVSSISSSTLLKRSGGRTNYDLR